LGAILNTGKSIDRKTHSVAFSPPHWVEWLGLQFLIPVLPFVVLFLAVVSDSATSATPFSKNIVEMADEALLGLIGMAMLGNSFAGYLHRKRGNYSIIIIAWMVGLLMVDFGVSWWAILGRISDLRLLESSPDLAHANSALRVTVQGYVLLFIIPLSFVVDFRRNEKP
jgi:hypothetical protein